MKTIKVTLIVSNSLMLFGRDGCIYGHTHYPALNPMDFDPARIPDYCVADMERLMFLEPGTYTIEVFRLFGSLAVIPPTPPGR